MENLIFPTHSPHIQVVQKFMARSKERNTKYKWIFSGGQNYQFYFLLKPLSCKAISVTRI